MDIKDCHIGQKVRTKSGRVGKIKTIYDDGTVHIDFGPGDYHRLPVPVGDLTPASDPCADCQKLEQVRLKAFWEGKAACYDQISSLIQSRDSWQADAMRYARNAHYWRDELTKLQKEALAESRILPNHCALADDHACIDREKCAKKPIIGCAMYMQPMPKVAKCYKQVEPDKLLLSQAARRVIEYLTAMNYPAYLGNILEGMKDIVSGTAIMDGIMEARDAGKIALVDGKYEIVRD